MAIRNLTQVYCSLNLGLVYNVSYNWSPQSGSTISVFFVKQDGNYSRPQYMQKAQIRIGQVSFSMYVVASDIQLSSGRRVMEVSFVDETFQLDNYLVVESGKGCGFNIYPLGNPVDNRTPAEKVADALDSDAQQIADFTSFPDLQYTFDEFLVILRQKFNVDINAFYNRALTAPHWGTFREVLDLWCQTFNLSWFIENGVIKIFDPTKLFLQLPTQPLDALEYNDAEDVRDTYGKTAYNWFQQEGGQFQLNQAGTGDDPTSPNPGGQLLATSVTLYPIGYESQLDQTTMSLEQVAAAYYGEQFWILYNYYKGTLSNCGWNVVSSTTASVGTSATNLGAQIASVLPSEQNGRFEAYQQYGEKIAGRYYLSYARSDAALDETYSWFDESSGQIFSFKNAASKAINPIFLQQQGLSDNIIPETAINQYYPGVKYRSYRMLVIDNYERAVPELTSEQQNLLEETFNSFIIQGSNAANYGDLPAGSYIMYATIAIPSALASIFDGISDTATLFAPRFSTFPIKGTKTVDYASLKATETEQEGIDIIPTIPGANIVGNTAVIKAVKDGAYNVYYNKYSKCASAHSTGPYFKHEFVGNQISTDNQVDVTFSKTSSNVYQLNRDYSLINSLVNNPILPEMAQARSFVTRRVSFSVNYFYNVPVNFLTNGLIGMSVEVGENGVTASYSFSNEVLAVPDATNKFNEFAQRMRNSWIRQYTPVTVIS